jgi:hypothetical protein
MVTKCFVEYEEASSQTRKTLYTMKYFDVHEKKGRCFSPSAQKAVFVGFVHTKEIYTWTKR